MAGTWSVFRAKLRTLNFLPVLVELSLATSFLVPGAGQCLFAQSFGWVAGGRPDGWG